MGFEKISKGIYRLEIPFDTIYTSVFLLSEGKESILLDTGTDECDVEQYLLPGLQEMDIVPTLLLCTHLHGDHCGGIKRLLAQWPHIKLGLMAKTYAYERTFLLRDGDLLLGRFEMLNLQGHSEDCMAVYDHRTKTLLTGDGLQQRGVGRYGILLEDVSAYRHSLARLRNMDVSCMVASHEYVPYGSLVIGADVAACLDVCQQAAEEQSNER